MTLGPGLKILRPDTYPIGQQLRGASLTLQALALLSNRLGRLARAQISSLVVQLYVTDAAVT
jgi:hypothetical protein